MCSDHILNAEPTELGHLSQIGPVVLHRDLDHLIAGGYIAADNSRQRGQDLAYGLDRGFVVDGDQHCGGGRDNVNDIGES
jgi:hypothetical protein